MISVIQKWGSFVRFSHTVFALPFALAAMMVAARDNRGWPGWKTFLLILAAMVCARTCAMAFNRVVDRRFDALNPRTKNRHLPTGQISLASAVFLCLVSAAGFVAASYFLNPICFYLSPVALIVICFYSLTKRFTDYTHVFLGIALALAPIGAWLAVKGGNLSTMEIFQMTLLALAVVLWLVGFDIIYALQDYEFDRTQGLHSPGGCLGTEECPRCRVPCPHDYVRIVVGVWVALRLPHSVCHWVVHHRRLSFFGTLDRAPSQFELDQPRLLSSECTC